METKHLVSILNTPKCKRWERDKGRKRMNRDFTENTSALAASLERSFSRYNHHTKEPFGSDDYVHNIRLGENSSA